MHEERLAAIIITDRTYERGCGPMAGGLNGLIPTFPAALPGPCLAQQRFPATRATCAGHEDVVVKAADNRHGCRPRQMVRHLRCARRFVRTDCMVFSRLHSTVAPPLWATATKTTSMMVSWATRAAAFSPVRGEP